MWFGDRCIKPLMPCSYCATSFGEPRRAWPHTYDRSWSQCKVTCICYLYHLKWILLFIIICVVYFWRENWLTSPACFRACCSSLIKSCNSFPSIYPLPESIYSPHQWHNTVSTSLYSEMTNNLAFAQFWDRHRLNRVRLIRQLQANLEEPLAKQVLK